MSQVAYICIVPLLLLFHYHTHVAGIVAGNGYRSGGKYAGIAPECNIVAIKILDQAGKGNSGDVLAGIQWIISNKQKYNICVANLSIGTTDIGYNDPLVRAVEAAWDNGIVMVIAAGNNGPGAGSVTSPGISKKVITVGSSDDSKKVNIWGSTLENFSGRGPTTQCIIKPDIIAPGADIVSCLTTTPSRERLVSSESKIVSSYYVQMSGTSMSTPIISGAVALLLQKEPSLLPDDVKYMLKSGAKNMNYPQNRQGWGMIDIEKLITEEVKRVR